MTPHGRRMVPSPMPAWLRLHTPICNRAERPMGLYRQPLRSCSCSFEVVSFDSISFIIFLRSSPRSLSHDFHMTEFAYEHLLQPATTFD